MSWILARDSGAEIRFIEEVSMSCAALGSGPVSQTLNRLVQSGKFREVVEFEIDYESGSSVADYCYARQIKALLDKQVHINMGYDRESAGEQAFFAAEEKCRLTNERLSLPCPEKDVSAVLHYAMRKISEVLGDTVPSFDKLDFFFGPGATTNVKGRDANLRRKLSARMACSEDMLPILGEFLEELPLWASTVGCEILEKPGTYVVPVDVSVGKLSFVPKSAKTLRPICVEPVLNSLLQKGIGSWLKRRLRKFGVDLFDQTRNQELARIGSIKGNLATIDLKSASDTVSIGLVCNLLPSQWVDLLGKARTGEVAYKDRIIHLEKFSSMGNGFTFELESLIFFGLMSGVISYLRQIGELGEHEDAPLGVYGDDLIIPTQGFDLARRVLTFCGFDLNLQKSFCTGPFRESCGADWFLGFSLRPFYLREEMSDKLLYSFHNFCARNGELLLKGICLKHTNRNIRLWGPDGYGDGHLIGSYVLKVPRLYRRNCWEGGYFSTYKLSPLRDFRHAWGDSLVPAYTAYSRASAQMPFDPFVIRGSYGVSKKNVYTTRTGIFIPNYESDWGPGLEHVTD